MTEHLDEMACLLYQEGQMERARAREVSAHTEECADCRELLRALGSETKLLKRAMIEEDEPLPERLAALPGRSGPPLPWIWGAVLGLAATGVYGLYSGYLEPVMGRLDEIGFGGSDVISMLIFQGAFWKGWQSMISLIQILAMATMAGTAALFARRWLRRPRAMAVVLSSFCVLLALPGGAGAQETHLRVVGQHAYQRQIYTLQKDEIVKNDLYVVAGRVRIDGTIDGDLVAAGESVDVDGTVTGDVIAFTKNLRVKGKVDGSVRVFASSLVLSGPVGRNVTSFTEVFDQDAGSQIKGGVTAFTDSLSLDGKTGRDVLAYAKQTTLTGLIGGNLKLKGRSLSIASTAQVQGSSEFTGKEKAEVSPEAKLGSPLVYKEYKEEPRRWASHHYGFQIFWTLGKMLFGLALFLLLPEFARQTTGAAGRYGESFGVGLLMLIGVPIAVGIACVTMIGIPLGIAAFFLWLAMMYCAQIAVGAIVGGWILGEAPAGDVWALAARMALGVVVIRIVFYVPHAGGLARLAVILWGMGAIALAVYKRFQRGTPVLPSAPAAQPA
jgi:cytoskeletal protein CcmA (bactofilin family)